MDPRAGTDLEELLLDLERRLMGPELRRHPDTLADLLEDGFVEHGSSGRVMTRPEVLARMAGEMGRRTFAVEGFRVRELGPGCALAMYVVVTNGEVRSLRSSIWRLHGGAWKMAFHQGTPCAT